MPSALANEQTHLSGINGDDEFNVLRTCQPNRKDVIASAVCILGLPFLDYRT